MVEGAVKARCLIFHRQFTFFYKNEQYIKDGFTNKQFETNIQSSKEYRIGLSGESTQAIGSKLVVHV